MRINRHTNETACHLSYCTNIHAGEQWDDLFPLLKQYVPAVKLKVSPEHPFGIGLRASRSSIDSLTRPSVLASFKQWLADEDLYVYTVNGFPYGNFHGTQVKADVYRPDWSHSERLEYTCAIANVLSQLAPPNNFASISTVPGTFKQWATEEVHSKIINNLLACVAHCITLARNTGVTVSVALEPEPACLLETVDDVVSFFMNHLYSQTSIDQVSTMAKCSSGEAEIALRTHIGVCYDICHAAVEFEDPLLGIKKMQDAGIPIIKLQLSSALKVEHIDELSLSALQNFDEPVYLHQVVEKKDQRLIRFNDLPIAIQAHHMDKHNASQSKEWRVHFHVPVFLSSLDAFSTTQSDLARVLHSHALKPIAPHLELETYTWDVLPEQYRNTSVDDAIAREINWVINTLAAPQASAA